MFDLDRYSGGLDCSSDKDGEFTYMWRGDITHVVYHVATLMPSRTDDKQCIKKKLHITNDHVTIVFNDSDMPFQRKWLAGTVNFVHVNHSYTIPPLF